MNWYEICQNNSGGSFTVNDKVCHRLYIEAVDLLEAKYKAERLGCYWDGVARGRDCDCCGDRWYLSEYNKLDLEEESIEDHAQRYANKYGWTKPEARIYYHDGKVVEIFSNKKHLRNDN